MIIVRNTNIGIFQLPDCIYYQLMNNENANNCVVFTIGWKKIKMW